jgi:hypothetical protein
VVEYSPLARRMNDVVQTSHDRHVTKPDESFLLSMIPCASSMASRMRVPSVIVRDMMAGWVGGDADM